MIYDMGTTTPGSWYSVGGRGDCVGFPKGSNPHGVNNPGKLTNQIVIIDGKLYKVWGVEMFLTGLDRTGVYAHDYHNSFGLGVREITMTPEEKIEAILAKIAEHWDPKTKGEAGKSIRILNEIEAIAKS